MLLDQHQCLERVIDYLCPAERVALYATGPEAARAMAYPRAFPKSWTRVSRDEVDRLGRDADCDERLRKAVSQLNIVDALSAPSLPGLTFAQVPSVVDALRMIRLLTALTEARVAVDTADGRIEHNGQARQAVFSASTRIKRDLLGQYQHIFGVYLYLSLFYRSLMGATRRVEREAVVRWMRDALNNALFSNSDLDDGVAGTLNISKYRIDSLPQTLPMFFALRTIIHTKAQQAMLDALFDDFRARHPRRAALPYLNSSTEAAISQPHPFLSTTVRWRRTTASLAPEATSVMAD